MNKEQEKVLLHYVATMLKVFGSERVKYKFIDDFKKAGNIKINKNGEKMTQNRFKEIVSTQKIVDTVKDKEYDGLVDTEFINLINKLDKECELASLQNEQLERRNKRQYRRLFEIQQMVDKRQWDTLVAYFYDDEKYDKDLM